MSFLKHIFHMAHLEYYVAHFFSFVWQELIISTAKISILHWWRHLECMPSMKSSCTHIHPSVHLIVGRPGRFVLGRDLNSKDLANFILCRPLITSPFVVHIRINSYLLRMSFPKQTAPASCQLGWLLTTDSSHFP